MTCIEQDARCEACGAVAAPTRRGGHAACAALQGRQGFTRARMPPDVVAMFQPGRSPVATRCAALRASSSHATWRRAGRRPRLRGRARPLALGHHRRRRRRARWWLPWRRRLNMFRCVLRRAPCGPRTLRCKHWGVPPSGLRFGTWSARSGSRTLLEIRGGFSISTCCWWANSSRPREGRRRGRARVSVCGGAHPTTFGDPLAGQWLPVAERAPLCDATTILARRRASASAASLTTTRSGLASASC